MNKINKKTIWIGLICLTVLCATVILFIGLKNRKDSNKSDETLKTSVQFDSLKEVSINLGNGMYITEVGKYTGVYMEDGSDEIIPDVLMITVENKGQEAIQYAEVLMPAGDKEAFFSMSTLTPGSKMILLEQNRMEYVEESYTTAIAKNVVVFSKELGLCEDKVKIQILDGVINITNVSGKDIDEDIIIYYKNSAEDVFYGGITYRARIEGGLEKGEVEQIMASHCSQTGSTIMFVTCGEN
ncbi:MAG: hypothetical protein U0L59_03825 [Faecalimonas sp.]|nr:hypothetical protein [Faecalimonas sp.]